MNKKQSVIFIGAHPDDIELACGGTLCMYLNSGYEVYCYCLTRGEECGEPHVREQESTKALTEILQVPSENISFKGANEFSDTELPGNRFLVKFLLAEFL